ncbi:homeobox-leucine zipper protein ROC8-like [Miscanthus floridulus]|uniref:homeobox-leucine zipper protein ROC8-like n=1 Tax=Miscanthus floridulus TaxID=154761 RepID=UPI00345AD083
MFKECPHPDENQRAALSRELGLEPHQIKFWFQNRRTQMKAQHERADNCFLRAENDKIRCENITMREALKNVVCPNCGGSPVAEDYFDEQKLRVENARLKEELDRVSSMTSKYLGRPFTQMPPVPTMSVSSLDLSMGGMPGQQGPLGGPSLDLDLLSGCSSRTPYQMPAPVTEMERPMMVDMATRAMDELIRLAQAGDQIWVKGMPGDAKEVLNVATYDSLFAKPGGAFRPPDMNVEGSRDSGLVFMSAVALVDVFMDTNKWMEFFPGIVSKAQTVDVLVNGLGGRSDSLIMMYEELHIMTPVVPTRELSFLRYCKQIEQGLWAVADISMDGQRDAHYGMPSRSRRMPSGCLIADMSNGYSKVIDATRRDATRAAHAPVQAVLHVHRRHLGRERVRERGRGGDGGNCDGSGGYMGGVEVGRGVAAWESSVYRGTSDTRKKTDMVKQPTNRLIYENGRQCHLRKEIST